MSIYRYSLYKDRTITLQTCDRKPEFYSDNDGKITYASQKVEGYIECINDDMFVSQVLLKERDDDKAKKLLLKDRRSRRIIDRYEEKIRKAYKKTFKANARNVSVFNRPYYTNLTTSYLKQYLLKFTNNEQLVTRLVGSLARSYGIYSLTDFINKPISLIKLKKTRNLGMKTVELYAKAYYSIPKQLIHSKGLS